MLAIPIAEEIMRRETLAIVVGVAAVAGLAFLAVRGCSDPEADLPTPQDPLSAEAAAVPANKAKVRLTRKPESPPADPKDVSFEWAILSSLPADPNNSRSKAGWSVVRYSLRVRVVGDDDARTTPEAERVRPKPGMMFVRHEGETAWAKFAAGTVRTYGTAGYPYHIPGHPHAVSLGGGGPGSTTPRVDPPKIDIFKPWTYSVEAKAGSLADVVAPLLTAEVEVELPAKVDILRVGDATTSLDIRP
jgi:hypothetical protein